MSQPAVAALAPLPFEIVYSDGEPLESHWHVLQIHLFTHLIRQAMAERGRTDFFTVGNVFVYYSSAQARAVADEVARGVRAEEGTAYRGPDVFWAGGVDSIQPRKAWVAWEEGDRLPDVIVELLSPSTEKRDRGEKKDLYARVFRTPEYYLCGPAAQGIEGFRLTGREYRPAAPDERGWIWSEQLGAFLGLWHGAWEGTDGDWLRLFRPDGSLVPTAQEQAAAAEAEVARLRSLLAEREQG